MFIVNLDFFFLQEKEFIITWATSQESNNVSSKIKPWCLHQALGLAKVSMMHWTGHTAGKLTCCVKGYLEHHMMKFEFVHYLWHCDHCLFWAHKDKKERNIKRRLKLCTLNYLCKNNQRKQDVMIGNLSSKLTFCTSQPSYMHRSKIPAILSIHVQLGDTFILT